MINCSKFFYKKTMYFFFYGVVFFIFSFFLPECLANNSKNQEQIPDLFRALDFPEELSFCGERVPLEKREVREELEKAMLLFLWNRAQVVLWLKRCGRVMPVVEKHLRTKRLPLDLQYVPVIESSLLAHAGSHAGAVGYWQFIPSTGRRYGLRIDRSIDQRRNLELSTQAGLTYLHDLYEKFGTWTLALAAYNMGESGLEARIKEQKLQNYYDLQLPRETMFYVYKALAAKLILSEPEHYGFFPFPGDFYRPIEKHLVAVQLPSTVPLQLLVDAAGLSLKLFREYNPEVLGNALPKGRHVFAFPTTLSKDFRQKIDAALKQYKTSRAAAVKKERWHTVRKGETLYGIANKYRIPTTSLMKWNNLEKKNLIQVGMRLRLQP